MLEINSNSYDDNICLISLSGEFDLFEKSRVDLILSEVLAQNTMAIIVDLSAITFIDSSGVGLLIAYYAKFKDNGVYFALVINTNAHVMRRLGRLLALSDPNLKFYSTAEEAKADIIDK